jgi:hypothetical protein
MPDISKLLVAFAFLLTISPPAFGTSSHADEELPLHAEKLSDRIMVAWVGDYMQTIRVVALSTARGIVVIERLPLPDY